jgi:hypothetical protein
MFRLNNLFRFQYALVAACALVTLLFLWVYRPLARNAARLDQSLNDTWKRLVDLNLRNKIRLGMDLETVSQNLMVAEKSLSSLKRASQNVRNQLEFDETIRERMRQPFQLLDYEQRRFQIIDLLARLAASNKVALDPAAVTGLPQYFYAPDDDRPQLLWAQLAVASRLLALAITNKVGAIRSLRMLPSRAHASPDSSEILFEEYPVHIVLGGSMESVLNLLLGLPSRSPPSPSVGPPLPPSPALFLDRVILKSAPGNANEVTLDAIICGFLNRADMP